MLGVSMSIVGILGRGVDPGWGGKEVLQVGDACLQDTFVLLNHQKRCVFLVGMCQECVLFCIFWGREKGKERMLTKNGDLVW